MTSTSEPLSEPEGLLSGVVERTAPQMEGYIRLCIDPQARVHIYSVADEIRHTEHPALLAARVIGMDLPNRRIYWHEQSLTAYFIWENLMEEYLLR